MAKKYLSCSNTELLKDFDIFQLKATVNSRCPRTICSCGAVHDDDSNAPTCSCTPPENSSSPRMSLSCGSNIVVRRPEHLLIDNISGLETVYYEQLECIVDQDAGTLGFLVHKIPLLTYDKDEYTIYTPYRYGSVKVTDVEALLVTRTVQNEKLNALVAISKMIGNDSMAKLSSYKKAVDRGDTLLNDVDFVNEHHSCAKNLVDSYYRSTQAKTYTDLCKIFEVPECLLDYLKDPYFESMIRGYNDIRDLDLFPESIQQMFGYYIGCKKMTKNSVGEFLRNASPKVFEDGTIPYINFVKKNLWMDDKVFRAASDVMLYLNTNKIPITEQTMDWKYYCSCSGVQEASNQPNVNTAIIENFLMARESQGIIAAAKRLIEDVKANEERSTSEKQSFKLS